MEKEGEKKMADITSSGLYPPIIDTYMPAFLRTEPCKVYFTLSSYNDYEDISSAEITVTKQSSNISVLSEKANPDGDNIKKNLTIYKDSFESGQEQYYINIYPSDLKNGFEEGIFYKVQVRLVGNNNVKSEWSTICLIKGINKPIVYLQGFDFKSSAAVSFNTTLRVANSIDLIGNVSFSDDNTESEYLTNYIIKIYDKNSIEIYNSGIIYTNVYSNPNSINYSINKLLKTDKYRMTIEFNTNNRYNFTKSYNFNVVESEIPKLNCDFNINKDTERGILIPTIVMKEDFIGNITIRRSSSKDKFEEWQDIFTGLINVKANEIFSKADYTIESGVYYKYLVQRRGINGARGAGLESSAQMVMFEDIFLYDGKQQIRVKYNQDISSFKYNISESRTDTIGSQFPFTKRNGNIKYREFPLSGTITYFMDKYDSVINTKDIKDSIKRTEGKDIYGLNYDNLLFNKEEYYSKEVNDLYLKYNEENNITEQYDYILEKDFRNIIIDFLYKNNVKLFKSLTEGNMLIKLMDINFTPKRELGRLIYDFSANAIEIGTLSFDNLSKYNIASIGSYNQVIIDSEKRLNTLSETIPANKEVLNIIKEKLKREHQKGYSFELNNFNLLNVNFDSEPYLIIVKDDKLYPYDESLKDEPSRLFGYIIKINDKDIYVNPNGVYNLDTTNMAINSISFPVDTSITLQYVCDVNRVESLEDTISAVYTARKLSQLREVLLSSTDIIAKIKNKNNYKDSLFEQRVISIDGFSIEAERGILFELDGKEIEISETGSFSYYDKSVNPKELIFKGIKLTKVQDKREPYIYEFATIDMTKSEAEKQIAPKLKNNYVYLGGRLGESDYLYYNNEWFLIPNINEQEVIVLNENVKTSISIIYDCTLEGKEYY